MSSTYWLEEPFPERLDRRLDGPVDVAIVGGGVTGCACARVLAEAGKRVRLHDARAVGWGASGRNGGFALRGGAASYDVSAEAIGRERARALLARDRAGARPDGRRSPATHSSARAACASRPTRKSATSLRAEYELLREDGFAVEWRDRLEHPLDATFVAAIFHPVDAALQPARWTRRLAALAAEAGVDIREGSRVDVASTSSTPRRSSSAPTATRAACSARSRGSIIPTRAQMVATEPIPERLFDCPHYSRHGFDYWQQREDGRILAGGFRDTSLATEFTTSEETTAEIQAALDGFVSDLVGWPVVVTHRWAGLFGFVPDFMPVVGPVPGEDGLWVAGGYSGHGMVLGFMCGELVANAILGRDAPDLDLFDPARLL